MPFEITRGQRIRPQKVVIYGPEGVGKTTLAAQFPSPLFIDTESSSDYLDVPRLPPPTSWQMLLDEVAWIRDYPAECGGTLVLDTADWAQKLAIDDVYSSMGYNSIEDAGYGKGYTYVTERFGRLLNLLSEVCENGINVVVTAHAIISKFEQPDEMGAYDRWGLKLIDGKKASVAAMLKEWADAVLFANYKTIVITTSKDGKVGKAQGGKNRMLYCSHAATWDAKNRWGLADEVPMEWAQIAPYIPVPQLQAPVASVPEPVDVSTVTPEEIAAAKSMPTPIDEPQLDASHAVAGKMPGELENAVPHPAYLKPLYDLMARDGITADMVSEAVYRRGYFPEGTPVDALPEDFAKFITTSSVWEQMRAYINSGFAAGKKE